MTGYKGFADVADYINAAPDNREREARKVETFGIRYGVTGANYDKTEARMLAHYGGTLQDYQRQLIEATTGMGLYAQLFGRARRPFRTRKQRRIAAQLKRVRPLLGVGPNWRIGRKGQCNGHGH